MDSSASLRCSVITQYRIPGLRVVLLCSEAAVEDFYEFIEGEKANYPVAWLCRILKVSRASFYRWRNLAGLSPRAVRHEGLVEAVAGKVKDGAGKAGRDQLSGYSTTTGSGFPNPPSGP